MAGILIVSQTVLCDRSHVGQYDSELEAALAYDAAARKHKGATPAVNFPVRGSGETQAGATTSRYRGVVWDKRYGAWKARIFTRGRQQFLGRFQSEMAAAQAY